MEERGIERTDLYVTNTLTRKKEIFKPIKDGEVKMFTCGPSIYSRPHIGNYATFLFEDILQRYLVYLGYRVRRVINFTDVEDKALQEAQKKGISPEELTEPVAKRFVEEADLLKIALPDHIPRASSNVDQAVLLIKILLKKGYAYWHGKDVFFDPLKFAGFGKLFGLDMSKWPKKKRRFRKDTYPGQRWNLGDFILWRGYEEKRDEGFYWEPDIGRGRPSWNIQDPAIVTKHLGYQIDIACGGVDNLYRHHDYNIAIIEGVSGKTFANYWLHGAHVLVDGAKMAKSKGNIVYPEEIFRAGYGPEHLRFYLIYGHYRKSKNLTASRLREAREKLEGFKELSETISQPMTHAARSHHEAEALIDGLIVKFEKHMNDDLDVEGAFNSIQERLLTLRDMKLTGKLSPLDSERIGRHLEKINSVLKVL